MSASEFSVRILQNVWQFMQGLNLQPIATLLAAFFGAWFAYRLQDRAKVRQEKSSNIIVANRALFTIFQQINTLQVFKMDIIDPVRNHPLIFIAMRPVLNEEYENIKLDFQSLIFLLNTKQKQVLLDLFVEQQRFNGAINCIKYRSKLHLEAQPALESAGINESVDYRPETLTKALEKALGPRLYKSLQSATDQVIYQVDRTVGSLEEIKEKIIEVVKELYPEGNFLNFKPLEGPANKRLQDESFQSQSSGYP
jgi:hypothetical protein